MGTLPRGAPPPAPDYKTLNGARVGDVFMSLIHIAELNGICALRLPCRAPAAPSGGCVGSQRVAVLDFYEAPLTELQARAGAAG